MGSFSNLSNSFLAHAVFSSHHASDFQEDSGLRADVVMGEVLTIPLLGHMALITLKRNNIFLFFFLAETIVIPKT